MKLPFKHSQPINGSVLFTTLVLGALLGITLASYLYWVGTQNVLVAESQAWNRALAIAEAGIEEGMAQVNVNVGTLTPLTYTTRIQGWNGSGAGPYTKTNPVYGYYVSISADSPPIITARGTTVLPLVGKSITRTVKVNTATNGLFGVAIAAIQNITMNGTDVYVDAYDSSDLVKFPGGLYNATYAFAGGDVATTSGFIDVGNADIHGRLILSPAASGYNVNIPNGLVGDMPANWPAQRGLEGPEWLITDFNKDFADVQVPYTSGLAPLAEPQASTNAYVLGSGTYYVSGDFTVNNNKTLYVGGNATLYVTGTFDAKANSTIFVASGSSLKLYVGDMTGANVSASFGQVNNLGNAYNFQFYGLPTCTSYVLGGNGAYLGTAYAPQAVMIFNGGGNNTLDFQGACVIKSANINGHFNIHYDVNLSRSVAGSYTLSSWQEL